MPQDLQDGNSCLVLTLRDSGSVNRTQHSTAGSYFELSDC